MYRHSLLLNPIHLVVNKICLKQYAYVLNISEMLHLNVFKALKYKMTETNNYGFVCAIIMNTYLRP